MRNRGVKKVKNSKRCKLLILLSLLILAFSMVNFPIVKAMESQNESTIKQEENIHVQEAIDDEAFLDFESIMPPDLDSFSGGEALPIEHTQEDVRAIPDSKDTTNELMSDSKLYDVEQFFFLPNGEELIAEIGIPTSIEVHSSQPTDTIRITLPKGADFSEGNTNILFEEIETFDNFSTAYLASYENVTTEFSFEVIFTESGYDQVSVEDAEASEHTAFLFTYVTDGQSRSNVQPQFDRSSVTVTSWSNFRSAWNNNKRTEILVQTAIFSTGSSLNTRTTGVTIGNRQSLNLATTDTLAWSAGTVVLSDVMLTDGSMNGHTLQFRRLGSYANTRGITVQNLDMRGSVVNDLNNMGIHGGSVNVTNELYMNNNRITTNSTVRVGRRAELRNFSIRHNSRSATALDCQRVEIYHGLHSWDIGSTKFQPDRAWETVTATIISNSITASTDPSFNDSTFQLRNASWIKSPGVIVDGSLPPIDPPPPPPIDPPPGPPGDPWTGFVYFMDEETGRDFLAEQYEGRVNEPIVVEAAKPGGKLEQQFPGYEFSRWTSQNPGVSDPPDQWGRYNPDSYQFVPYFVNTNLFLYYNLTEGTVTVNYVSDEGEELAPSEVLTGKVGTSYRTEAKEISGWQLIDIPTNAQGQFTVDPITVEYIYEAEIEEESGPLPPVDPLDPDKEIDPDDKPETPEEQGLLSIDFASHFRFSKQEISSHDTTYNAEPQKLLDNNGNILENEDRPNYVQISDRRGEGGWQLTIRQSKQFESATTNRELFGAELVLRNQEAVTVQGGSLPPAEVISEPLRLIPGESQLLMRSTDTVDTGKGTWVYRFGDGQTAGESVQLDVPTVASPEKAMYKTTLVYELSAVPGN